MDIADRGGHHAALRQGTERVDCGATSCGRASARQKGPRGAPVPKAMLR